MTVGLNKKTECIREMIDQHLRAVSASELIDVPAGPHVDEDTIAAFVEGRLADDECQPVLAHLAACGACRRASAQIVQLENQIDTETLSESVQEPGRLETLLSKFGSLVPSTNEEVVFAYQNPDEDRGSEKQSDATNSQSHDETTTE